MKLPGQDCVCVGHIAKAHGFKGAVRIDIKTGITLDKPKGTKEPVFLEIHQKPVPFFYTSWQENMGSPIVHFEDIDSQEKAQELLGLEIWVPDSWVEESDELSLADLIDYTVEDEEHGKLGFISNYMETPGQTILYMMLNGREVMIPFVDEFVTDIDHENKILHTRLPDGLLDL